MKTCGCSHGSKSGFLFFSIRITTPKKIFLKWGVEKNSKKIFFVGPGYGFPPEGGTAIYVSFGPK